MLSAVEDCIEQVARTQRRGDRPLAHPIRRPGGVRGDPARGHRRRVPDRSRADAEPPADEAGEPRRSDHAGRARPAGADPGEGGAPVHRRPGEATRDPSYVCRSTRAPARAVALDLRRRRLPGPGARGRDGARRLHDGKAEGLGRAISRSGAWRRSRPTASASSGAPWTRASTRRSRTRLRQARRLLGVRFPKAHAAAFGCSRTSRSGSAGTTLQSSSPLLNAQPMGFYPPATLVRDAQRRGVEVSAGRQPERKQSAR